MSTEPFTPRPPEVRHAAAGVSPPAPAYIAPGENLIVRSVSSVAAAEVVVTIRVLSTQGTIHVTRYSHTTGSSRTPISSYHPLTEGWLLSLTVTTPSTAIHRGSCHVTVNLQFGEAATGVPYATLVSDFLVGTNYLAWPGGRIVSMSQFPGELAVVQSADPAAGSEFIYTVPANTRLKVRGGYAQLVTDATVANREPTIQIDDGALVFLTTSASAAQTASLTRTYYPIPGGPSGNALSVYHWPLPHTLILGPGSRVQSVTAALQAGDNWGRLTLFVERVFTP